MKSRGKTVLAATGRPAPRKLPAQSRSRFLVATLIEACRQILEQDGAKALTVQRLSEVSGVAVGSIYQYFPNKDAVISLAFEQVMHEEMTVHVPALRERVMGLALEAALREIIQSRIRLELRLFRLHSEFHQKYHADLHVGLRSGAYGNARRYVDEAWRPFVDLYCPELDTARRDMAAHMLGIGLRAMVRAALEHTPERVTEPAFADCLLHMALGALRRPATV